MLKNPVSRVLTPTLPSSVLLGVRSPRPNSPPGDDEPTDDRPIAVEDLRGMFLAAWRAGIKKNKKKTQTTLLNLYENLLCMHGSLTQLAPL